MAETRPKVEKRQVNVRLPVTLIEELDERRAQSDLSRDEAVARMLRFALKHGPKRPTLTRRPIPRRTP